MDLDWGQFVEMLLAAAIPVLVPAILAALFAWWKQRKAELELAVGTEWWAAIEHAVETAVRAAEQAGIRDELEKAGEQKLAWAIETAEAYLDARGLGGLDLTLLVELIEAEVNKLPK